MKKLILTAVIALGVVVQGWGQEEGQSTISDTDTTENIADTSIITKQYELISY
ncbi:hypothetical protein [Sphingobacterium lumbrici]|uniref:hypothetical protein n=1 Tax=Sphingobacterium lumbrici TaxID=2559600 RepID=UPI0015E38EBC|nr:hypothetical protein [Sphingobacterium lumbrici]